MSTLRIFSTLWDVQYIRGISSFMWRIRLHLGDTMRGIYSTLDGIMIHQGDIVSTLGGCSVYWRGIVSILRDDLVDKNHIFYLDNSNVLNIPQCTHDIGVQPT